ncbi:MAG: TIGR03013 family XrtA/PEP-CTERM system glycosyltransferase [Betaproteobacteria bacterium]
MVRIFRHYVSARSALLVCLESLVITLAAVLASAVRMPGAAESASGLAAPSAAAFPLAMIAIVTSLGLYQSDVWQQWRSVYGRLLLAAVLAGGLAVVVSRVAPPFVLNGDAVLLAVALAVLGAGGVRYAFYKCSSARALKSRLLVLGTGSRVARFAELAQRNPHHLVVGYLPVRENRHYVPAGSVLELAPGESIFSLAVRLNVDRIVVGILDRRDGGATIQELLKCKLHGIKVTELSAFFESEYRQVMLESVNPAWMVFGDGFPQGFARVACKRAFDVLASLVLLVIALPVLIVAGLCILIESGAPVLYRQERVGEQGRSFTIYKLRTMRQDAEKGTPRWAAANDNRVTALGRLLRKFRIDELPQIVNVLRGDMSFVGPRPERPFFVDQLSAQIPYYALRHNVKPGITGWAQVRYPYGACVDDAVEKLQYDLYYAKNHGLFLDLLILFATFEVVLWGKGAR